MNLYLKKLKTLKILFIVPNFTKTDGRSYYIYLLIKYLLQHNINCFLLTSNDSDTSRFIPLGIKVFHTDIMSKNPLSIFRNINLINSIQKENSIDIIHNSHRFTELLTSLAKSKNNSFKSVMTVLSIVSKKYFIEYNSDRLITVSSGLKNVLINDYKKSPDLISVIHPFIDSQSINLSNLQKPNDKFVIYADGRFHREKNFITLLNAIELTKNKNLILNLSGEGEDEQLLRNYCIEKNLPVNFLPPVYDRSEYFNTADLCVLPSIRDPFPLFMLLAGAYKKTFIGADTDGIPELIVDSKNGLLFPKTDFKTLAEKIQYVMNNSTHANLMAENLNNDVMKNFTEKSVIPKFINLLESLLK